MGLIKSVCLSVLFILFAYTGFAQLAAFQDESDIITPTFRYDVIHTKKIASLTIHVEEKPDGQRITDDGIMQFYRFDSLARLSESHSTIKESYDTWDTVRSRYYYDKNNHLVTKRTNNKGIFDTWYYVWYEDGTLKKEAHVYESAGPGSNSDFKIGTQKVISCDSFAYNIYPKQVQRFGYNELNALYEKVITQYDDKKRMLGRYSHYQVGWLFSQVDIKYDSVFRIKEYTYASNLNGDTHKTVHLTYDKYGNILVEKVYIGDKQEHEIEYLYDNSTGLISDKLDRDYDKKTIEILKFSYTFLDEDDVPPPTN
jgi:hypothetical protein